MDPAAVRLCRSPGGKQARLWLDTLPLAEPDNCIEQMQELFTCFNAAKLAPRKRLQLLEAMRGTLDTLLPQWVARCDAPAFPERPAIRRRIENTSALLQALCAGFSHAVPGRPKPLGAGVRASALACQRYLHYANWLLFLHRATGRPAPKGLWQQLHACYRQAVDQRFVDRLIDDPLPGYRKTSVGQTYRRLLLTALAPIQEFETRWWEPLLTGIGLWARTLQLVARNPDEGTRYFVAEGSDEPPKPAGPDVRESGWYLDASAIALSLKRRLHRDGGPEITLRLPERELTLPRGALERFRDQWCRIPGRHSARQQAVRPIPSVIVLGALHHILSPETDQSKAGPAPAEKETSRLELLQDRTLKRGELSATREEPRDVWDSIYAPSAAEAEPPSRSVRHWRNAIQKSDSYRTVIGRTEDVSRGGACLSVPVGSIDSFRVGSLVGIQSPSGHWRAGVVSWFTETGARLRFGIRHVIFRCTPAAAVVLRDGKPVTRLSALAGLDAGQHPIVILPGLAWRNSDELHVQVEGVPYKADTRAVRYESERYVVVAAPGLELPRSPVTRHETEEGEPAPSG